MYTQGVVLLTDGNTSISAVKAALDYHGVPVAKEAPASDHWGFSGDGLLIAFRPEVNGYALIDVVNQPWPDAMGDPNADPTLFGVWSMGNFGPFAYPGGLARARQHAWGWPEARTRTLACRGFVRIRLSYVFGGRDDAPVMPADYDALAEMTWLNTLVVALIDLPGVICYFNPNGEVLTDRDGFRFVWDGCRKEQKIPVQLWSNVRLFDLDPRFIFMDTVGNSQLDLPDVEAIFPKSDYDAAAVSYYLLNVTVYLIGGATLRTADPIDGPGETNLSWTIETSNNGIWTPPRKVVRLCPHVSQDEVKNLLSTIPVAS